MCTLIHNWRPTMKNNMVLTLKQKREINWIVLKHSFQCSVYLNQLCEEESLSNVCFYWKKTILNWKENKDWIVNLCAASLYDTWTCVNFKIALEINTILHVFQERYVYQFKYDTCSCYNLKVDQYLDGFWFRFVCSFLVSAHSSAHKVVSRLM